MNGYCHAMNICNSVVDIMAVLQNIYDKATILYHFLEKVFGCVMLKKSGLNRAFHIFQVYQYFTIYRQYKKKIEQLSWIYYTQCTGPCHYPRKYTINV